jgi:hypothetical protein
MTNAADFSAILPSRAFPISYLFYYGRVDGPE